MRPFDVAVLTYDDYPEMLERCLTSMVRHLPFSYVNSIFILCNEISSRSKLVVQEKTKHISERLLSGSQIHVLQSEKNCFKYPFMRRIIYGDSPRVTADYLMWFDDDSLLTSSSIVSDSEKLLANGSDIVGAIYRSTLRDNQVKYTRTKNWCQNPKKILTSKPVQFTLGGWWAAKVDKLRSVDYPYPELKHRGGDVALGVVANYHGWKITQCRNGVLIGADSKLREVKNPRRGEFVPTLGSDYNGVPLPHCEVPDVVVESIKSKKDTDDVNEEVEKASVRDA